MDFGLLSGVVGSFSEDVTDQLREAVPSVRETAVLRDSGNCMVGVIGGTSKQVPSTILDGRGSHTQKTQNHQTENYLTNEPHNCLSSLL